MCSLLPFFFPLRIHFHSFSVVFIHFASECVDSCFRLITSMAWPKLLPNSVFFFWEIVHQRRTSEIYFICFVFACVHWLNGQNINFIDLSMLFAWIEVIGDKTEEDKKTHTKFIGTTNLWIGWNDRFINKKKSQIEGTWTRYKHKVNEFLWSTAARNGRAKYQQ